ncbi:hypothetical protein FNV43_RR04713 [Rhamnella rubrinervis]|uniref:Ycf20-like protein n=1 Tax=Rhamnella rubrinervis TaxID=2594499 RepID=A0A8K0MPU1_9ROSA|nr:hypothetical protein FNV43_RR04713 [Rhamnella rubrinervis]
MNSLLIPKTRTRGLKLGDVAPVPIQFLIAKLQAICDWGVASWSLEKLTYNDNLIQVHDGDVVSGTRELRSSGADWILAFRFRKSTALESLAKSNGSKISGYEQYVYLSISKVHADNSRWIKLKIGSSQCRTWFTRLAVKDLGGAFTGRVLFQKFMACQIGTMMPHSALSIMENETSDRSCTTVAICSIQNWSSEPSFSGRNIKIGINSVPLRPRSFLTRRHRWKLVFALDTGGVPGNGEEGNLNGDSPDLGGTRLGRIVSAGGRQLLEKLNSARKNVPMKIFLLLLGFYTANALATILGQTGDWDVLVAGIVVAAIEGIGMLMYRKPPSLPTRRLQSFVSMMNYWKAGVCLGLFVDAFKLGS